MTLVEQEAMNNPHAPLEVEMQDDDGIHNDYDEDAGPEVEEDSEEDEPYPCSISLTLFTLQPVHNVACVCAFSESGSGGVGEFDESSCTDGLENLAMSSTYGVTWTEPIDDSCSRLAASQTPNPSLISLFGP